MDILLAILAALAAMVLLVLLLAARKPPIFRIERRILVAAPPSAVYAVVGDFSRSREWSPWEQLDPQMTRRLTGTPDAVGAVYEWDGDKSVGAGRQEIVEKQEDRLVRVRIDFHRPMNATNTVDYTLRPVSGGTEVSWAMYGPNPLMSRVMGLFVNIDRMVGRDFERGLASLKRLVEGG
jgi:Polyketide cyclase / dehydrase and lipid transport.